MPDMSVSDAGLTLIKKHEGWRPHWYQDPVGVWTIGWGTTAHVQGVTHPNAPNDPITKRTGGRLLRRALRGAHKAICQHVAVSLTQGQYDALCSFIYNVGAGAFADSTLLQKLNAGNEEGAAREFKNWVYAGGKVWDGLVRRRETERKLFEGDAPGALGIQPIEPADMHPVGPPLADILAELQLQEVPQLS